MDGIGAQLMRKCVRTFGGCGGHVDFRRNKLLIVISLAAVIIGILLVVDHLRASNYWSAAGILFLPLVGCYLTLQMALTPYARLSQSGMALYKGPGLKPRMLTWDTISGVTQLGHGIVYIRLASGRPIEVSLWDISRTQRSTFIPQVEQSWRTHRTTASS